MLPMPMLTPPECRREGRAATLMFSLILYDLWIWCKTPWLILTRKEEKVQCSPNNRTFILGPIRKVEQVFLFVRPVLSMPSAKLKKTSTRGKRSNVRCKHTIKLRRCRTHWPWMHSKVRLNHIN